MEKRLNEIKTKITSFVQDYDIKDFKVYINSEEIYRGEKQKEYKVNSIDISLEV